MEGAMAEETEWRLKWKGQSELAYKVETDDGETIWLPKSQVELGSPAEVGKMCDFLIPDWLAEKAGLT